MSKIDEIKDKIDIDGMTCEHCAAKVKGALEDLGLDNVKVDLDKAAAFVENKADIAEDKIKETIEDIGYKIRK